MKVRARGQCDVVVQNAEIIFNGKFNFDFAHRGFGDPDTIVILYEPLVTRGPFRQILGI